MLDFTWYNLEKNDTRFSGYTKIQDWFLDNDPAIISETALAFERGQPKNDNGNFDFSSKSL